MKKATIVKKETYIYGGAFNPPTIAHLVISQAIADRAESTGSELWIMPSGQRHDKTITTSVEKRLSYAHGLLASLTTRAAIQVCDAELYGDGLSETVDTREKLVNTYPDRNFVWVSGSDSMNTMHKWRGGPKLLRELSFLIVSRPGFALNTSSEVSAEFLFANQPEISSTEVRNRIVAGLPVEAMVPKGVLPLI